MRPINQDSSPAKMVVEEKSILYKLTRAKKTLSRYFHPFLSTTVFYFLLLSRSEFFHERFFMVSFSLEQSLASKGALRVILKVNKLGLDSGEPCLRKLSNIREKAPYAST